MCLFISAICLSIVACQSHTDRGLSRSVGGPSTTVTSSVVRLQPLAGATTTTSMVDVHVAAPDHAPGTTLPYRGPCANPDVAKASGVVEQWTGGASFHGLRYLTTLAMGL